MHISMAANTTKALNGGHDPSEIIVKVIAPWIQKKQTRRHLHQFASCLLIPETKHRAPSTSKVVVVAAIAPNSLFLYLTKRSLTHSTWYYLKTIQHW